jgi:hypothetical protein
MTGSRDEFFAEAFTAQRFSEDSNKVRKNESRSNVPTLQELLIPQRKLFTVQDTYLESFGAGAYNLEAADNLILKIIQVYLTLF